MKKIIFLLIFISTINTFASDLYTFSIPDKMRIEGTYSAETNDNGSMHLIILKDKKNKNYMIKSAFVNADASVDTFKDVFLDYLPSIISYHNTDNVMSLIDYNRDNETLTTHHFDRKTKSYSSESLEDVAGSEFSFRLPNETWLFDFNKKIRALHYYQIKEGVKLEQKTIELSDELKKEFKVFRVDKPVAINQNEYVTKGALQNNKVIFKDGKLIFTIDDQSKHTTKTISFDLNNPEDYKIKTHVVENSNIEKIKDYNSYMFEDTLFTMVAGKNDFEMVARNINTGEMKNTLSLKEDISKIKNDYEKQLDYLSYVAKGKIRPTIAVNATKRQ